MDDFCVQKKELVLGFQDTAFRLHGQLSAGFVI